MSKLESLKISAYQPARCLRCGKPTGLPRGQVGIGYEGVAGGPEYQHMEALHGLFAGKHLCWPCFTFLSALLEAGLKASCDDELMDMLTEIRELLAPFGEMPPSEEERGAVGPASPCQSCQS